MPEDLAAFFLFTLAIFLTALGVLLFSLLLVLIIREWKKDSDGQLHFGLRERVLSRRMLAIILGSISIGMMLCLCGLFVPSTAGVIYTLPKVVSLWKGEGEIINDTESPLLSNYLNKNTLLGSEERTSSATAVLGSEGEKRTPSSASASPHFTTGMPTITPLVAATSTVKATTGKTLTPTVFAQSTGITNTPTLQNVSPIQTTARGMTSIPEAEFEGTPPPPDELLPEPDEEWEDFQE